MTLRGAIWRMLLLLVLVPPPSEPASSDSCLWSGDSNKTSGGETLTATDSGTLNTGGHRDAYGALRDNAMLPGTVLNMVPRKSNRDSILDQFSLNRTTPLCQSGHCYSRPWQKDTKFQ